jgi:hypothetical protein
MIVAVEGEVLAERTAAKDLMMLPLPQRKERGIGTGQLPIPHRAAGSSPWGLFQERNAQQAE